MADRVVITEVRPESRELVINVNVDGRDYPQVVPFLSRSDANALRTQLRKFARDTREDLAAIKAALETDPDAPVEVSPEVEGLVGQDIDLDEETSPTEEGPTDPETPAETPAGENPDGSTAAEDAVRRRR